MSITTIYYEDGNPFGVQVTHGDITVVADTREQALEEILREQDRRNAETSEESLTE